MTPPGDWVLVYEAGNLIEGQMVQARLEQEGIPAQLRYEAIHVLIAPAAHRVEVWVPESEAERAQQILMEAEDPSASG